MKVRDLWGLTGRSLQWLLSRQTEIRGAIRGGSAWTGHQRLVNTSGVALQDRHMLVFLSLSPVPFQHITAALMATLISFSFFFLFFDFFLKPCKRQTE